MSDDSQWYYDATHLTLEIDVSTKTVEGKQKTRRQKYLICSVGGGRHSPLNETFCTQTFFNSPFYRNMNGKDHEK